ncbi:DUF418 domain-containing protein [Nocardia ninae]|uniref:Transporter n=1 Tax=Nocardia ninae NBRC 108245 TaxID=1210091 RepID=A0A511MHQ5_9NOCA|nr:DUF418 domain-containing protein [Nocardia ninae]GEM40195.1 transporter [Nocardia ninae NBRC 108245]
MTQVRAGNTKAADTVRAEGAVGTEGAVWLGDAARAGEASQVGISARTGDALRVGDTPLVEGAVGAGGVGDTVRPGATVLVDDHVRAGVRLVGVDLARGLAVLGMYAAHVGPEPGRGGVLGFAMEVTHGRSSALFAFLAGFSILLITGRRVPKTGQAGRQARVKILIRAVILLVLGTALTASGTKVEVILAYYGLYFLLALPLARLRAGTLAVVAVVSALVLPQIVAVVMATDSGWTAAVTRSDPLAWLSGRGDPSSSNDGVVGLLLTGSYPALSWLPFVVAGMAVARLDLADKVIRVRLAATGLGLATLGYGGSAVALHFASATTPPGIMRAPWWSDMAEDPAGWRYQLSAMPHSETTLSIVGNTGVALAVLIACLAACDGSRRFLRVATPLIAVGSMALTAYVFHVAAIAALGFDVLPAGSLPVLLGLSAIIMMFAYCWSRFFHRGPLEWLLYRATRVAERVR